MKILIITTNVGGNAPGMVFEKLINGLSENNMIDILTSEYKPENSISKVNKIIHFDFQPISFKLSSCFFSFLSFNPIDFYYARNAKKNISESYDLIFSFVSSGHTVPLQIGSILQKQTKIKHFTYFVDAIPAPIEWWLGKKLFYKGMLRFIKSLLKNIDGFFTSNQSMLEYQMRLLPNLDRIISGVIYNPIVETDTIISDYPSDECNIFVYTGNIYGLRTAKYIIEAFQRLLKDYPNSKLQFIGAHLPYTNIEKFEEQVKQKIELIPFTTNLQRYYEQATALIDIDAELENDVFMSSKIANYLVINRLILCETGHGSPSSNILKDISSVILCSHDSIELYNAMRYCIEHKNKIDFDDRKKIIQQLSLQNVISNLEKQFEKIKK